MGSFKIGPCSMNAVSEIEFCVGFLHGGKCTRRAEPYHLYSICANEATLHMVGRILDVNEDKIF